MSLLRCSNLSKSTIWDQDYILNDLNKNKKTTYFINKLRSQFLVPSSQIINLENESKIPVLIIQNGLQNNLFSLKNGNLYAGWDLIVPSSWGSSFWLTLIHHGAKALGQNEINYLMFESGNLQFPNEFLDTSASQSQNNLLKHELYRKYLLKPPSKRVIYLKLGFLSPFHFPMKSIVNINNHDSSFNLDSSYFILRNKQIISKIIDKIFNNTNKNKQNSLFHGLNEKEIKELDASYVCVRLIPVDKGKIEKYSLLYFSSNTSEQNYEIENLNSKREVEKLVKIYKNELLSLTEVKTRESTSTSNKLIQDKNNFLLNEVNFHNHQLGLAGISSYKKPIGFVCTSGFSLANGQYSANGFILTKILINLINNETNSNNHANLTRIDYRTPSANIYKQAKITQVFF